jgi:hypothetical protein
MSCARFVLFKNVVLKAVLTDKTVNLYEFSGYTLMLGELKWQKL